MTGTGEEVRLPDGPQTYHDRQVTPRQFLDMQLGSLASSGAEVELVHNSESGPELVQRIVIDDVRRTFWAGSTPDNSRPASPKDKEGWLERDCVTYYWLGQGPDGTTVYNYDHLPAYELGLVQKADGSREYWLGHLFWYLRWPE